MPIEEDIDSIFEGIDMRFSSEDCQNQRDAFAYLLKERFEEMAKWISGGRNLADEVLFGPIPPTFKEILESYAEGTIEPGAAAKLVQETGSAAEAYLISRGCNIKRGASLVKQEREYACNLMAGVGKFYQRLREQGQ